jgi:hypothetical protein
MAYNTSGLWPILMLMPFFFSSTPLYAICVCGVVLVSCCGHFVASIVMLAYSPGAISSLLLVCPAALYSAYLLCTHYFVGHPSVYVAGMASGGLCHVAVGGMFFTVNLLGLVPEKLFPIAMYWIFSVGLGTVCRLFGGPTEKFIQQKQKEKDAKRYKTLQGHLEDIANEDEHSALL